MRDALLNYFPQMEEVETGERTKRWRITQRSLNSFISFLHPYGFLYGQRDHYLVAKHSDGYDNGKAHNFSLQCIKSVEILPNIFDSSEFDLNEYALESFGAFHEEPFEVEWLFSANVADEAENFIFHPKQKLTRNPDGTLTVKFRAGGKMEMDWFLYTWGDDVKVIKPKDWYKKK